MQMTVNSTESATPRYEHDCDNCNYLGIFHFVPRSDEDCQEAVFDLYFCSQGGIRPTVIARESSEPSEYSSGFGVAQYIVQKERPKYPELSFEALLEKVIKEERHLTIRMLTDAALRAYRKGLLTEESFYPKAT